jgi:hypothetical protein
VLLLVLAVLFLPRPLAIPSFGCWRASGLVLRFQAICGHSGCQRAEPRRIATCARFWGSHALEVEAFPTATHKGPVLLPSRIGHLACGPSAEGPDPVGAAYNLGGSDDVVKIGDKNVFPMACVRAVTSDDRTAGEWLSVVERRTAGLDVRDEMTMQVEVNRRAWAPGTPWSTSWRSRSTPTWVSGSSSSCRKHLHSLAFVGSPPFDCSKKISH